MKGKETREYLGVTITSKNYREILEKEGRDGINFHTKHLRAYLKGKTTFRHKFLRETVIVQDEKGQDREVQRVVTDSWGNPKWNEHRVQSAIKQVPTDNA
jgi:hypothetical protein